MAVPETPQITTFQHPDEDPLSMDGAWAQYDISSGGQLKLEGNSATSQAHTIAFSGYRYYSYYTRQQWEGDVEVWACTVGGQLGASLETWRIGLAQGVPSFDGGLIGYQGFYGGGIAKFYEVRRYDSGTPTPLVSNVTGPYPERMLLRTRGDQVELWSYNSGTWTLRITTADTTYRGPFNLYIGVEDPTLGGLSFDCFGGGKKNWTRHYRLVQGQKHERR